MLFFTYQDYYDDLLYIFTYDASVVMLDSNLNVTTPFIMIHTL